MNGRKLSCGAFSLVEVALALAVASFCLLTLLGLLSVGISSTGTAASQTNAVNLMGQVLADLRAGYASTPALTKSPFYLIPLPINAASATMTTSPNATTVFLTEDGAGVVGNTLNTNGIVTPFRVTVGFLPQSAVTGSQTISVRVVVSWPAQADANPAVWPSHYTGSVETIAAIRTVPW